MRGRRTLVLTALMTICTAPAAAAPEPFSCPAQLPLTHQSVDAAPAGWEATTAGSQRTQHDLIAFAVNGGPPGSPNGEIFDQQDERKDGQGGATRVQRWHLQGMSGGYAICSYFRTRVELVRPLGGYSTCEVTFKRSRSSDYRLVSATCR